MRVERAGCGQRVDYVWTLNAPHGQLPPLLAVPDGGTDIVWNLGDAVVDVASGTLVPATSCVIVGTHATASGVRPTGSVDLVGIRLRPGGLFGLIDVDLHELVGSVIDSRDVGLRLADEVERSLRDPMRGGALRRAVEGAPLWRDDPGLRVLLNRREVSEGMTTVTEVARSAGLSVRQLERRVWGVCGHTVKRLLRLRRLDRALRLRRAGSPHGWAGVAAGSGFADQAHLSREVRALTGLRPRELDVASVQAAHWQLGEGWLYPTPGG